MIKKASIPTIDVVPSLSVSIDLIDNNDGQIPGVNPNPREMTRQEFKLLVDSLKRDPSFSALSEIRVFPHEGRFIAIGGNMRLRAMRKLKWKKVVCKVLPSDTDADTLNRWILLDNANYGKWDFAMLAAQWEKEMLDSLNIELTPPEIDSPEEKPSVTVTFHFDGEQAEIVREALVLATKDLVGKTFDNDNAYGNALYTIVQQWSEIQAAPITENIKS